MLLRRNVIVILMSVELMLNAVNLTFVALARQSASMDGQVIVFFVIDRRGRRGRGRTRDRARELRPASHRERGRDRDAARIAHGRRDVELMLRWIPLLPILGTLVGIIAARTNRPRLTRAVSPSVIFLAFLLAFGAVRRLWALPAGGALVDTVFQWIRRRSADARLHAFASTRSPA